MDKDPQPHFEEFEPTRKSKEDGTIELIVIGALLTLLLALGTPLLGKISGHSEGPSLQVIREGN